MQKKMPLKILFFMLFFIFFIPLLSSAEVFESENGAIKISLDGVWEEIVVPEEAKKDLEDGIAFKKEDPLVALEITISKAVYQTELSEKEVLDSITTGLKAQCEKHNTKWISDRYITLFNNNVLVIAYEGIKDVYTKQMYFLENEKLHSVKLISAKNEFDKQWSQVENNIYAIEFIKVSKTE